MTGDSAEITVPWEAAAEQLVFIGALVAQYRRAALRERDAEWAAALKASHYDSIEGLHSEDCFDGCARLRALLEEAGK